MWGKPCKIILGQHKKGLIETYGRLKISEPSERVGTGQVGKTAPG